MAPRAPRAALRRPERPHAVTAAGRSPRRRRRGRGGVLPVASFSGGCRQGILHTSSCRSSLTSPVLTKRIDVGRLRGRRLSWLGHPEDRRHLAELPPQLAPGVATVVASI